MSWYYDVLWDASNIPPRKTPQSPQFTKKKVSFGGGKNSLGMFQKVCWSLFLIIMIHQKIAMDPLRFCPSYNEEATFLDKPEGLLERNQRLAAVISYMEMFPPVGTGRISHSLKLRARPWKIALGKLVSDFGARPIFRNCMRPIILRKRLAAKHPTTYSECIPNVQAFQISFLLGMIQLPMFKLSQDGCR